MKKFKLAKLVSVLLIVILTFSIAVGCGQQDTNTSQDDTSSQEGNTNDSSSQVDDTDDTTSELDETEEADLEHINMEMFVNHSWWPLSEWGGSVPEEITKRTGITIDVTVAADEKQLPLLVASGDLPELVYTDNNQNMHTRLSDPNLSFAWNELIGEYAPDFEIPKEQSALYTQPDGNFYTILNNFSTEEEWNNAEYALTYTGGMTLRSDILDELDNPEINTLEDLSNVFGMVKEKYPDLIPLVMNSNWTGLGGQSGYFLSEFGLMINGFYVDENDNLMYYIKQPGRLDYYKYMNSLYRNGYIMPENYTFSNEDESYEYAYNLDCFAYAKSTPQADELNHEMKRLGHDVHWKQIVKPLSDKFAAYNASIGWSGVFITKNNKNPDRAINFMKFLYSEEGQRLAMWGIEGEHWTMANEGYPIFDEKVADPNYSEEQGIRQWGLLIGSAVIEGLANFKPTNEQTVEAGMEVKKHVIYKPALGMLRPDADSEEQTTLTKLNDMVKNEEIKILLAKSDEELNAAYENMLELAKTIGADKLEEWANEKYQSALEFFK